MKIIFKYSLRYFKNLINFNNLNISMKRNFRFVIKNRENKKEFCLLFASP